jgi:hypothetical protein
MCRARCNLDARRLAFFALVALALTSCKGDLEQKLAGTLSSSVDSLTIGETEIIVKCRGSGEEIRLPTTDLEMNALGLADLDKLTAVAQKIKNSCEGVARSKRDAENTRRNLEGRAKDLKIAVDGKSNEELQTAICDAAKLKLPVRGDKRTRMILENNQTYGCPDPGEPVLPKWGYWEIDKDGAGKELRVSLKIDSDDEGGERVDRFAVRCVNGKADAYIASTEQFSSAPIKLTVDGKPIAVKPKVAADKKALLFSDVKKLAPALSGKEKLELTYKTTSKKTITRQFSIQGFDAAMKQFPKKCRS